MGLLKKLFIFLLFIFVAFIVGSEPSHAVNVETKAKTEGLPDSGLDEITENTFLVEVTFDGLGTQGDKPFRICPTRDCIETGAAEGSNGLMRMHDNGGKVVVDVCGKGKDLKANYTNEKNEEKISCGLGRDFFGARTYNIAIYPPGDDYEEPLATATFQVGHAYTAKPVFSPMKPKNTSNLKVKICGNRYPASRDDRNRIDIDFNPLGGGPDPEDPPPDLRIPEDDGCYEDISLPWSGGTLSTGRYVFEISWAKESFVHWRATVIVTTDGSETIKIVQGAQEGGSAEEFVPGYYPEPDNPVEVQTPFGVIQTSPQGIAAAILSLAIGVAGGVAFLLMIFGAYRLMFAAGNPESIQQGREVITAAVAGLILIIFAVFILRFLGVSVFQLVI